MILATGAAYDEFNPNRSDLAEKFIKAFGELGSIYFADGLSLNEAYVRHNQGLREENSKLRQKVLAAERGFLGQSDQQVKP